MSSFRVLLLVACLLLSLCSVQAVDFGKYNARVGKKFLDENKAKEGITTTASGLQYKVLETGSGTASPTPSSQVKVHYRGTLLNGKEFDSSYTRGSPATFGVGQVIKGSAQHHTTHGACSAPSTQPIQPDYAFTYSQCCAPLCRCCAAGRRRCS